jgi:predicted CoA-binding protein
MPSLREAAEEFLAQKRIAVAGVSRDEKQPANLIYRRLRATGHDVFAVNPNATELEGDPCFSSLASIPEGVDGVVVVTTPQVAEDIVAECAAANVPRVWLHRGLGPGSSSEKAVDL